MCIRDRPKGSYESYRSDAFARWLQGGRDSLDASEQKEFLTTGDQGKEVFDLDMAATRSDGDSGAGLTESTTRPSVVSALDHFGGIGSMAQTFNTADGNDFRVPVQDDAKATGNLLGVQDSTIPETAMADFEDITFNTRTVNSGFIYITREMLQDSVIDVAGFANRQVGRRIGRTWDMLFTRGGTVPTELDGNPTRANAKAPETDSINHVYRVIIANFISFCTCNSCLLYTSPSPRDS